MSKKYPDNIREKWQLQALDLLNLMNKKQLEKCADNYYHEGKAGYEQK